MEFVFGMLLALGVNGAAVAATFPIFKNLFISERKFHVLTDEGQVRVVQGPRRSPLKASEAEAHLREVRRLARSSALSWPLTFWRLYGPRRTRAALTDLDKIRQNAIESQRRQLLVQAMNSGFEDHPVMSQLMRVNTDAGFEVIKKRLILAQASGQLSFTPEELKVIVPQETEHTEIVLIGGSKRSVVQPVSPSSNAIASGSGGKGHPLPEGYSWGLRWDNKNREFEQIVVVLMGPEGKEVRSEGIYTSVYSTEDKQRAQIKKLQAALALAAKHDISEGGFSPELRELI